MRLKMELEDLNIDEVWSLLESKGFEPDLVSVFFVNKKWQVVF